MTESARPASPPLPPLRQAFENRVDAIMRVRGLPRPEAERLAYEAALIEWLNATHPDTLSDRCAHCGELEEPGATLLPIGVGSRHPWLHRDCWERGESGAGLERSGNWRRWGSCRHERPKDSRFGAMEVPPAAKAESAVRAYARCFHCRRPIVYGAKWIELVNDNARARFHSDCAPAWRTQQQAAARRAIGLDRSERL
jgi:hypothetical protein